MNKNLTNFKDFLNSFKILCVSTKPFFLRGEIRYTPSDKGREIWVQARPSHINSTSGTLIYIPYGKKGKGYRYSTIIYGGRQGPVIIPGRQDPTSKQRPSPGGQRPSPARAPTRTSRRAGIGQGDLPHTKVATSLLRMQGDRKEQHSSHSLNQWKERFILWHRHAGTLTGSEPYKLRGILSKELRSLMTRLGPSHERGPGTQPHIGPMLVSEFSVRIHHTTLRQCIQSRFQFVYNMTVVQCVQSKKMTNLRLGQWPNVTSKYHTLPESVLSTSTKCSYRQGNGPILFVYIMWPHWKEGDRQSPTSVIPWKLRKSSVLWNFSYLKESKESVKCF